MKKARKRVIIGDFSLEKLQKVVVGAMIVAMGMIVGMGYAQGATTEKRVTGAGSWTWVGDIEKFVAENDMLLVNAEYGERRAVICSEVKGLEYAEGWEFSLLAHESVDLSDGGMTFVALSTSINVLDSGTYGLMVTLTGAKGEREIRVESVIGGARRTIGSKGVAMVPHPNGLLQYIKMRMTLDNGVLRLSELDEDGEGSELISVAFGRKAEWRYVGLMAELPNGENVLNMGVEGIEIVVGYEDEEGEDGDEEDGGGGSGGTSGGSGISGTKGSSEWRGRLVINEIMGAGVPASADYVEIMNIGGETIDIGGMMIGKVTGTGRMSAKRIGEDDEVVALEDGEMVALTRDVESVVERYGEGSIREMEKMPTLAAEGTVMLLDADTAVVDSVRYWKKWHHPLVKTGKGVALERIDAKGASNDGDNWTSGSVMENGGTPGRANSASKKSGGEIGMSMNSNLIEPNGGGMRAAESLKLKVSLEGRESGVTMEVYDVGGRLRAVPYNNVAVSGGSCELEWNGRDMNGRVVGGETYVVVVTVWSATGGERRMRCACTVVD